MDINGYHGKKLILETYHINFGSYFIHNPKITFSTLSDTNYLYISNSYHHSDFGKNIGSIGEFLKNSDDNDLVKKSEESKKGLIHMLTTIFHGLRSRTMLTTIFRFIPNNIQI